MGLQLYSTMLFVHIALGFSAFFLGAIAVALPKTGRNGRWHRRVGRVYAPCMLGMAALSVPLALRERDYFLLVLGLLTLGWVAGGWIALRLALRVRRADPYTFAKRLRTHIILMGSSYIGAWTAFLVNVGPLGNAPLLFWVYALGPTVIGSVLISRASARSVKIA